MLGNIDQLREEVGKAGVAVWLYDDAEFYAVATGFRLALNAYLRLDKFSFMRVRELNNLLVTDFQGILEWARSDKRRPLNRANLGVASYFFRRWRDCIRFWTTEENEREPYSFKFWQYLGKAYEAAGDFQGAIKAFEEQAPLALWAE